MDSRKFWDIFLKAWTEDRGEGDRSTNYDKQAWMYVQWSLQNYFREQEKKNN